MGAYLSKPNKTTETEDGGNSRLSYGAASMQGWRVKQEDAHNAIPNFSSEWSLFAVYDGHGGAEVAQFTAAKFPDLLRKQLEELDVSCAELAKVLPTTSSTIVNELPMKTTMAKENAAESSSDDDDAVVENGEKENLANGDVKNENGDVKNDIVPDTNSADESPKKENGSLSPTKASPTKTNGEASINGVKDDVKDERPKVVKDVSKMMATAFLDFDDVLRQPSAMDDLKLLAGKDSDVEDNNVMSMEEERADAAELAHEAHMPLQEVLKQYGVMLVKNKKGAKFLTPESNAPNMTNDDVNIDDVSPIAKQPIKRKTSEVEDDTTAAVEEDTEAKRVKVDGTATDDEPRRCFSVGPVIQSNDEEKKEATAADANKTSPRQRNSKSECLPANDQKYNSAQCNEEKIMKIYEEASKLADGKQPDSPETLTAVEDDETSAAAVGASASVGDVSAQSDESSNDGDYVDKDSSDEVEEGDDDSSDDEALDGDDDPANELEMATLKEMFRSGGMAQMLARRLGGQGEDSDSSSDDDEDDMTPVSNIPSGDTPGEDSGCTACVALVSPSVVCVANAGDSRAVMCRAGVCVELSYDHKPDDEVESRRIHRAGGKITPDGRVNGGLNLSRAIGDHFYKKTPDMSLAEQMITADPDVVLQRITTDDEFIVIACDGIWNSLSSADVVTFVRTHLASGESPRSIAEKLCFECLAPNTDGDGTGCDNMTVLVVLLNQPHVPKEGEVNGDTPAVGTETNGA